MVERKDAEIETARASRDAAEARVSSLTAEAEASFARVAAFKTQVQKLVGDVAASRAREPRLGTRRRRRSRRHARNRARRTRRRRRRRRGKNSCAGSYASRDRASTPPTVDAAVRAAGTRRNRRGAETRRGEMRRNRRGVDGLEDRTDDAEIGGEKDAEIWRDEIWRDEDAEIWREEDAEIRRDVCRDAGFIVRHRERFLRHGRGGGGGARRHASRGDAAARESRGGGGEGEVSTRGDCDDRRGGNGGGGGARRAIVRRGRRRRPPRRGGGVVVRDGSREVQTRVYRRSRAAAVVRTRGGESGTPSSTTVSRAVFDARFAGCATTVGGSSSSVGCDISDGWRSSQRNLDILVYRVHG